MIALADPIGAVKGVGPARAEALARLGIATVEEALALAPRRYEDRRRIRPVRACRPGGRETVLVDVREVRLARLRGMAVVEVLATDGTGLLVAKWFNQPYQARRFRRGARYYLSGLVRPGPGREMVNPEAEPFDPGETALHAGRIVPIYPLARGLSQRTLRALLKTVVDACAARAEDFLPAAVREARGLPPRGAALAHLHFPGTPEEAASARRRLAYEDLFLVGLAVARARRLAAGEAGIAFPPDLGLEARLLDRAGFHLTGAQARVLGEIRADLAAPAPMNRLVQGDVGSGKTILAHLALAHVAAAGYQGALMAPTELLAAQHHARAAALLEPLGIRVVLLSGRLPAGARAAARTAIAAGQAGVVVGTHALLEAGVDFRRLGLVVIDEQHRFGVLQRARLRAKGLRPDLLVMTATPIPRTLALTLYGDLEVSLLDEWPPGRRPVGTRWVGPEGRAAVYRELAADLAAGGAAFVVCPAIEAGEAGPSAVELAAELRGGPLGRFRLGVVHSRVPAAERDGLVERFRDGGLDVLVATSVIEVGLDIPRATAMVVEGAERFGLAQLHQLRGRVGRGERAGACHLIAWDAASPGSMARLEALVGSQDGFALAERDLELRGPGDFLGTRQAGLPDLGFAPLLGDLRLLEAAREDAAGLVARDPELCAPELGRLRERLERRWASGPGLAAGG
jgi:ATP-dependent DNA helicase RecG